MTETDNSNADRVLHAGSSHAELANRYHARGSRYLTGSAPLYGVFGTGDWGSCAMQLSGVAQGTDGLRIILPGGSR